MLHSPITLPAESISEAELVASLSYALDITEGQPAGHCIRACWIGFAIGRAIGLSPAALHDLYYTLLLKDLGCSSNAARICELYQADDLAFKQGFKPVGTGLAATLHFVFSRTARHKPFGERASAIANILRNGDAIVQEVIVARCTRGADIARSLRFSKAVCAGIYHLDEHWDGSGRPSRRQGDAIPLNARIALLAQVIDVFHGHAGKQAAIDEARRRSGSWFDPALVQAFEAIAASESFWLTLKSPTLEARVVAMAQEDHATAVDDDYLDSIANAFGQVIDAKSPYTSGHSARVAALTEAIASRSGIGPSRRRWLRRAAFLHDIGKLGVSNSILDKPAALDEAEWHVMRSHAAHTREILGRIGVFRELAEVAGAHHERLDGTGYPLGLGEREIAPETRIITTCDFFDALTADRPYRGAMPIAEALRIMEREVGRAIDPDCFEALRTSVREGTSAL